MRQRTHVTSRRLTGETRPGRALGVIVRTETWPRNFVFGQIVATSEELFIHKTVVDPQLWPGLSPGTGEGTIIRCRVSETDKGLRGFDVERAHAHEVEPGVWAGLRKAARAVGGRSDVRREADTVS